MNFIKVIDVKKQPLRLLPDENKYSTVCTSGVHTYLGWGVFCFVSLCCCFCRGVCDAFLPHIMAIQIVSHGPAALTLPGSLFKMQNLGPQPRPTESEATFNKITQVTHVHLKFEMPWSKTLVSSVFLPSVSPYSPVLPNCPHW